MMRSRDAASVHFARADNKIQKIVWQCQAICSHKSMRAEQHPAETALLAAKPEESPSDPRKNSDYTPNLLVVLVLWFTKFRKMVGGLIAPNLSTAPHLVQYINL